MEKHTSKGLKGIWGDMDRVRVRAKRGRGTSAPTPEETKVYQKLISRAKRAGKTFRVLVMGATPELRDAAIDLGAETWAVDVSPKLMLTLTEKMHHKLDDNNLFRVGDWLEMDKYFGPGSFDAVVGDASFNNIPFKSYNKEISVLHKLLRPGGLLITRHGIYKVPDHFMTVEEVVDRFRRVKGSALSMMFDLGCDTEILKKSYNPKTKELSWINVYNIREKAKKLISKQDAAYFENIIGYARDYKSIVPTEKEFLDILKSKFALKQKIVLKGISHSSKIPIFVFKKR